MAYAVITGASKGIGKEIAFILASKGYDLLIAARNSYELQIVKEDIERKYHRIVEYLPIDLGLEDSSEKLFQWVLEKEVDVRILVNNAGYGLVGPFEDYDLLEHKKMLQVNVNAVVELCYKFFPVLSGKGEAYVLNIASSTAYQAIPLMSLYAASKVFVLNFSRGLHHEWKNKGISVTSVSPGATDTNFNDRANLQEKARKAAKKVTMTPEKVAQLAIDGMFAQKPEVITGFINKLGAALAWVAPKKISEKVAMGIYE
ncbi:SDR family oxidoreductase [Sandaracinomonas limnophila]|uniref:SDR family oxidoreductase n=1 Tax=Sandaracinomonas limnophila TaxID=1862386 RepID=A0A437PTR4_9BACT|nr:SDR family oxidoreductase [Sandaracinomonas limnophila]RVU25644.1 SDR family oxidoreductase [Sandaracinomonas limnophila]